MKHKFIPLILSVFGLVAILALGLAVPVRALETKTGETIVIKQGEVIDDDLYASASQFVLDGTIKGDLVVVGSTVTIGPTGLVEGDLIGAGQGVTINGEVADDARIAGAVLMLGPGAMVGDDLIAAGYSLETKPGSVVGGDLLVGGNQVLLAGDIAGNLKAAANGVDLQGSVGGDVDASVGSAGDTPPFSPFMFMPNMPSVPTVTGGLTVRVGSKIGGDLNYESGQESLIPPGTVAGNVNRTVPQVSPEKQEEKEREKQAASPGGSKWFMSNLSNFLGLLVFGLLMVWIVPKFVQNGASALQAKPLPSLGWGLVSIVAVFLALFALFGLTALLAVFLGIATLGDLVGTIVSGGMLAGGVLIFAFVLAVTYVAKVIVSFLVGRWILLRFKPEWAVKPYLPLILGVVIYAILVAFLTVFPFVGGAFGGFFNLIVVLFGLGALWLLGKERFWPKREKPAVTSAPVESLPSAD